MLATYVSCTFCGFASFINWALPFSEKEAEMATGSSEVASPNTRLVEKDLAELHRVLHPVKIKYKSFGLQIGVGVGEIACMYQDCLLEILTVRVRESEPLTWNDIVAALREECVGLGKIANDIREKYAHLFTPTISMASEYEHRKEFDRVIREADSEDDEIETCRQRHERISEQDSDEEVGGREKRTQSLRKRESKHEIKSKGILKQKEYASIKKKSPGGDHRARVSKEGERSSEYEGIEKVRFRKHVQEVESEDEEGSVLSRKEKKELSTKGKRKGGKPAHDREKQIHDKERAKGMNKKDKFTKDESHSEPEEVRKEATTDQEEEKIESEDGYTVPEEATTESESEISSERETLDPEICERKELLHAKAAKSEHYELSVQNPKRLKVEETQSPSRDSSSRRKFVNVKGRVGRKGKSRRSAGVKTRRHYEAQRGKKNAGNNPKYSETKPVQSVAPFLGKKSKQHSLPEQEMKGENTSKHSSSSEEEMQSSSLVLSIPRSVLGGIEESTERSDSESYSSGEQEEPDPRGERRRKKRIRETSDTPLAIDPSSYPTSENETRRKCGDSEWQKRKSKHARRGKERHRERERQESSSSSSETDDSSPECDRNLSESESRKLKRLFKCAFGRLCRAITNPDEVAAELQAKRLLSRSATEMILTSPESKQGKAIFLVRALARRIKPRPDRIFTAIEVFLSSEGLQDIGAEMKIKAGKLAFHTSKTCV